MKSKKENIVQKFLAESNAIEQEYSDSANEDAMKAWQIMNSQDTLDLNIILATHKALMQNLNQRIAGNLRNCNVRVGYRICPDHSLVFGLLAEWLRKYSDAKTEEEIKVAHVNFELIHPFEDGNGRIGRIIMNWQRVKNGLPILIIHTGEEQYEYYNWFNVLDI